MHPPAQDNHDDDDNDDDDDDNDVDDDNNVEDVYFLSKPRVAHSCTRNE